MLNSSKNVINIKIGSSDRLYVYKIYCTYMKPSVKFFLRILSLLIAAPIAMFLSRKPLKLVAEPRKQCWDRHLSLFIHRPPRLFISSLRIRTSGKWRRIPNRRALMSGNLRSISRSVRQEFKLVLRARNDMLHIVQFDNRTTAAREQPLSAT